MSKSITELIKEEIKRLQGHQIQSLSELCQAFGNRSVALAILIFSILVILPIAVIPGFSTLLGIVIILFAVQILSRQQSLWLPRWVANKQIPADKIKRALMKVLPRLESFEHLIKPRLAWLSGRIAQFIISIVIIFLAILLMLPIPFSNFFYGIFIGCLALGLLERDGLVILIGLTLALLYHLILFGVFGHAVIKILQQWF